jgi:hypothetical protein
MAKQILSPNDYSAVPYVLAKEPELYLCKKGTKNKS